MTALLLLVLLLEWNGRCICSTAVVLGGFGAQVEKQSPGGPGDGRGCAGCRRIRGFLLWPCLFLSWG